MNTRQHTAGLAVVSLTLLLAACGGGTADPPLVGTPVTSTADSGTGSLRDLLGSAKDGDTLRLASGTVTLAGPLKVTKSVTLDLGSSVIDAAGKGRTLEIPNGVTVTIKGGTLKGGTGAPITVQSVSSQALSVATYGGVLVNEGTLTLDGTVITGGTANNGGGIANLKTGTLTLRSVTMSGNTATIPTPDLVDESTGSGGAIANIGILTVESGTFTNNTAFYSGGAIRHSGGNPTSLMTIKDGLFENNGCTFPNTKNAQGGTDGCVGGALQLGNNTNVLGGTFRGNKATIAGGVMNISKGLNAVVNISGGTFENNSTTGTLNNGGGAILTQATLNISGGTFKGNSSMYGGAVDVFGGGSLALSGGLMEGNTATQNGGALQTATSASAFTMTGGTLRGNTAGVSGGGIQSNIDGTLSAGTIENNTAQDSGGGMSISAQGAPKRTVTLSGTLVIQGNKAGAYGGGVNTFSADVGGLTVNLQGASIRGNAASNSGGGVNMGAGSVLNLSAGSIADNTAVMQGGGVVVFGTLQMTGGSVTGNRVTSGTADSQGSGGGGGIRVHAGGQVTASGGAISSNSATFGAGVLATNTYQALPAGSFILSGAIVSNNTALGNVGGGFFNDGKLLITSGSVTGNTAKQNGGGVFNTKQSTFAKTGGDVTGNAPNDVFQGQ